MHNYRKGMHVHSIHILKTKSVFAPKPANYHPNKVSDYACERPRALDRSICKPFTNVRHNSICLK